jgi:heme oxygenase
MIAFGQIYEAFEERLALAANTLRHDARMFEIYELLYIPSLLRASKLRTDLDLLRIRLSEANGQQTPDMPAYLKSVRTEIEASLSAKPHIVLAYMWAMYLALFNGGRWIQKQLLSASSDFWCGKPLPLSFWAFDDQGSDSISEDELKTTFKTRFSEAATKLRKDEVQDVIQEAVRLFDLCSGIIEHLDKDVSGSVLEGVATTIPILPTKGTCMKSPNPIGVTGITLQLWQQARSAVEFVKATTVTAWRYKVAPAPAPG